MFFQYFGFVSWVCTISVLRKIVNKIKRRFIIFWFVKTIFNFTKITINISTEFSISHLQSKTVRFEIYNKYLKEMIATTTIYTNTKKN